MAIRLANASIKSDLGLFSDSIIRAVHGPFGAGGRRPLSAASIALFKAGTHHLRQRYTTTQRCAAVAALTRTYSRDSGLH